MGSAVEDRAGGEGVDQLWSSCHEGGVPVDLGGDAPRVVVGPKQAGRLGVEPLRCDPASCSGCRLDGSGEQVVAAGGQCELWTGQIQLPLVGRLRHLFGVGPGGEEG